MSTQEQRAKMLELARKSQDVLHQQVALMKTITYDSDEVTVTTVLDQVDALKVDFEVARKELHDYRNSVLNGTEE